MRWLLLCVFCRVWRRHKKVETLKETPLRCRHNTSKVCLIISNSHQHQSQSPSLLTSSLLLSLSPHRDHHHHRQEDLLASIKVSSNPFSTTPQGPTLPYTPIISALKARSFCPIQTGKFALLSAKILTKTRKLDAYSTSIKASLTCKKLSDVHREMDWYHHAYGGTGRTWVERNIWEEEALWVCIIPFLILRNMTARGAVVAVRTAVVVTIRCHVMNIFSRPRALVSYLHLIIHLPPVISIPLVNSHNPSHQFVL
jgi:hypothetical protein